MAEKLHIVLFGGNTKQQDGPLLTTAKILKKRGCKVTIVTDTVHLKLPTKDGKTLEKKLIDEGFKWHNFKNLELAKIKKIADKKSIGFSLHSSWIFKKDVIDYFNEKLFNYHDSPLPKFRGAAGYSWLILQKERNWGITIHRVSKSLDAGDIIKQKLFKFPKSCKIPLDYLNYKSKLDKNFLEEFIQDLILKKPLQPKVQNKSVNTYWPRISTPKNGFINWEWNSEEIELFIDAFDDPHQGASSFIDGKKVRMKKCFKNKEKISSHPFQAGLIFKKEKEKIFVATADSSLIFHEILDEKNQKINHTLKLGHRFFTPQKFLDKSLSS